MRTCLHPFLRICQTVQGSLQSLTKRWIPLTLLCYLSAAMTVSHASVFYKFDIVAQSGVGTLVSINQEVSINDTGRVAFIGHDTASSSSFDSIWVGDGFGTAPRSINPTFSGSSRDFGFPQINNRNLVAARDRVSGSPPSYLVRTWSSDTNGWTTMAFFNNGNSVTLPSISNDGFVSYVELDSAATLVKLYTATSTNTLASYPGTATLRPMVAEGGFVVLRAGNSTNDPIVLIDRTGTTTAIASSANFAALGRSPGISDDGSIVTFYGNLTTNGPSILTTTLGPGIFASVDAGAGTRKVIRVADNTAELGFDDSGSAISLRSFIVDNRVGISHLSLGAAGITDDTFVVCFMGTPSSASRTNPATGKPLFFSNSEGVWTVRVDVERDLSGTNNALEYHPASPLPVVQLNDNLGGQPITNLFIYDPIANAAASNTVVRTQRRGGHNVAFWASTAAAQFAVRAAHLDSDGDGLLDHWETDGIDIDQDGTPDLDLRAMGANPLQRDVFLEIDWLTDQPNHVHRPDAGVIQSAVNLFAAAPALSGTAFGFRSDGTPPADIPAGITVHVDAGGGTDSAGSALSTNMGTVALQGGDSIGMPGSPGTHLDMIYFGTNGAVNIPGLQARAFHEIKDAFFGTADKRARELAFHYIVMADFYMPYPSARNPFQANATAGGINWLDSARAFPVDATGNGVLPGHAIKITSGRGAGQVRMIAANNVTRIVVSRNWSTVPDGTSAFALIHGSSGRGELALQPSPDFNSRPGNDVVITLGGFGVTPGHFLGGSYVQWRTLVHELGHNLGLRHCGVDPDADTCINTPNAYLSLMSYAHQTTTPATYANRGVVPVNTYAGAADATFNDWANLKLDFQDTFAFLGNTFGKDPGNVPMPDTAEMTIADAERINGGPLDLEPPVIKIVVPVSGSLVVSGSSLPVHLIVTDNTQVASVEVTFDVNANGTLADAGERILATPGNLSAFNATFTNVTGTAASRTLKVTAFDTSMNLAMATSVVVVADSSCSYSIASTNQSVPAIGGPDTIALTASGGCPWAAQPDSDWITVTSGANGSGNGMVQFAVSSNKLAAARAGNITVAGQTFTVNQAAGSCTYVLGSTNQSFGKDDGVGSISVSASAGCSWTAATDASWISIMSAGTGVGNGTIDFAVGINPNSTPRSATIVVENQMFAITQAGFQAVVAPALLVTQSGGSVIFTWPATFIGFQLQTTSTLGTSAIWSDLPNPVVTTNGQFRVIEAVSGKQRFYRLYR